MLRTPLVNKGKSGLHGHLQVPSQSIFVMPQINKHIFLKYEYTLSRSFEPISLRKGITLLDIDDPWRSQRYMALCYSARHQLTDQTTQGLGQELQKTIQNRVYISNPPHLQNHKLEGEMESQQKGFTLKSHTCLFDQAKLITLKNKRRTLCLIPEINIGLLAFTEL